MKYCVKCVQPDTRPGIYFDKRGVCGACLYEEEKEKVDWNARAKELRDIAEHAKKTTKGAYDCAIGVSGGKDSTFQALYARDKLGLRALLVNNEPDGITEIGRHNIENLINLGFDTIKVRPNPQVMKKLMKRDFYNYLNPAKITEYALWSCTYIISQKFGIPLIIQGENAGLTLGVRNTGVGTDGDALNACKLDTLSEDYKGYIADGINEKDLYLFHYDRNKMEKSGTRGVWLQYYVKEWSASHNAEFSIAHRLRIKETFDPNDIGTYGGYYQMDTDFVQVNQMLKYIKFGFGQCTDHACYDIRAGKLAREEAIELVRKYDGKCSDRYIKATCDTLEITIDEFWKTANRFRGPMWDKNAKGEWVLKNPIWEQSKISL